jgi:ectoine hydroxylase-related dioxygenase (phytanoyl-CoA dioxygenase family)
MLPVKYNGAAAGDVRGPAKGMFEEPTVAWSADGSGGLVGPVDLSSALVFHAEACMTDWERLRANWRALGLRERPPDKAAHIFVPSCRAIALHPALLRVVEPLVGAPMMLATMSFLVKPAGWEHRWHSDIENYVDPERCPGGSSWTVWLPLRHASAQSTLHLVTHTHDVNRSAHDIVGRQCKICRRDPSRTLEQRGAALLALSRSLAPRGASSQYIRLAAHDGGAWLFKGRTWHAAANPTNQSRLAVQMHFMPTACRFRVQTPNGNKVYTRRPLGVVPLSTSDPSAGNLCLAPARQLRSVIEAATAQHGAATSAHAADATAAASPAAAAAASDTVSSAAATSAEATAAAASTAAVYPAAAPAPHTTTAAAVPLPPNATRAGLRSPAFAPPPQATVDVCAVVASARPPPRTGAPPPLAATELMLRSLRAGTSAPVKLHLLIPQADDGRAGVEKVVKAQTDDGRAGVEDVPNGLLKDGRAGVEKVVKTQASDVQAGVGDVLKAEANNVRDGVGDVLKGQANDAGAGVGDVFRPHDVPAGIEVVLKASADAWEAVELIRSATKLWKGWRRRRGCRLGRAARGRWRHYCCTNCSWWKGEEADGII